MYSNNQCFNRVGQINTFWRKTKKNSTDTCNRSQKHNRQIEVWGMNYISSMYSINKKAFSQRPTVCFPKGKSFNRSVGVRTVTGGVSKWTSLNISSGSPQVGKGGGPELGNSQVNEFEHVISDRQTWLKALPSRNFPGIFWENEQVVDIYKSVMMIVL